jgi:hypothetical protein
LSENRFVCRSVADDDDRPRDGDCIGDAVVGNEGMVDSFMSSETVDRLGLLLVMLPATERMSLLSRTESLIGLIRVGAKESTISASSASRSESMELTSELTSDQSSGWSRSSTGREGGVCGAAGSENIKKGMAATAGVDDEVGEIGCCRSKRRPSDWRRHRTTKLSRGSASRSANTARPPTVNVFHRTDAVPGPSNIMIARRRHALADDSADANGSNCGSEEIERDEEEESKRTRARGEDEDAGAGLAELPGLPRVSAWRRDRYPHIFPFLPSVRCCSSSSSTVAISARLVLRDLLLAAFVACARRVVIAGLQSG